MYNIEYIVGDVRSQPFETTKRLIPHVCNDLGRMGAGVAKALYTKWPKVKEYYTSSVIILGDAQVVPVEEDTIVFNMIAQHSVMVKRDGDGVAVAEDERPPIRYAKLVSAMELVSLYAGDKPDAEIHCPMFGCDLAGGDWRIVQALIKEIWCPRMPVKVCVIEESKLPNVC